MDLSKLKKRPSYPFETIAVAISFAPTCQLLLAESKRLADVFGASLLLLHVGGKTSEKERMLDAMMDAAGVDSSQARVIWMEGDPVDTILKLCKLNIVDLLVLGALQKENLFKFYIGSVARNISRKAKCSVLLFTNLSKDLKNLKKIIVNGVENPKTIHTINTALYLAKHLHIKDVVVVNELDVPVISMESTVPEARVIKRSFTEEVEEKLHAVIKKSDVGDVKVTDKIIKGKPGYAISKFARDRKADLLVINSPDTNLNLLDRIFAHDIEYILADLPCNVLIVHSRV